MQAQDYRGEGSGMENLTSIQEYCLWVNRTLERVGHGEGYQKSQTADRQTDRQTDRREKRQTDKQTERPTDSQRDRHMSLNAGIVRDAFGAGNL